VHPGEHSNIVKLNAVNIFNEIIVSHLTALPFAYCSRVHERLLVGDDYNVVLHAHTSTRLRPNQFQCKKTLKTALTKHSTMSRWRWFSVNTVLSRAHIST